MLVQDAWWGSDVEWFGVHGGPDLTPSSRSLAWHLPGMYVMANMWWEPLTFDIQVPGRWQRVIDTTVESGFVEPESVGSSVGSSVVVGPRSICVVVEA